MFLKFDAWGQLAQQSQAYLFYDAATGKYYYDKVFQSQFQIAALGRRVSETTTNRLGTVETLDLYYDADGNIIYYYTGRKKDGPVKKFRSMVDIPLIINFNFGAFSSFDNKKSVGFFAGGGLAYHYGPVNVKYKDVNGGTLTDSITQHSFGPVGNIGMRIGLGKKQNGAIEVKGSFMKSLAKRQPDIYGISVLYILPKLGRHGNPINL